MDVVRRYFALELAPALDPGYQSKLAYPAALALQYPEIRPMAVAPLLDLLFGLDLSKHDQAQRKERFPDRMVKEAIDAGRSGDADLMRLLNAVAPGQRRGRPSGQPVRPLWSLYQSLLLCQLDLAQTLFETGANGGYYRRVRLIQEELEDLSKSTDLDALALMYGLLLEALELADLHRVLAAKKGVLSWLPTLRTLPACRRVHPILERAVRRACDAAVPRTFNRAAALDRVRPASWRTPGPFVAVSDLAHRFPSNADAIDFFTLRDMNIEHLTALIEKRAITGLSREHEPTRRRAEEPISSGASTFPFKRRTAGPLRAFHLDISARLRHVEGWAAGRFWIIQKGTRCAIAATGQASFPLMLVDFGYVRGDPVADRPIVAMPWILADVLFVDPASNLTDSTRKSISFLRRG